MVGFTLASLSAPVLAACGGGTPTREAAPAQVLGPVTLQFWTNNTANVAYAKEFESLNPTIKMDAASIGDYDVLAEKALTNVAAGTPPNISILGQRHGITQLSHGGALRDVETLLTEQERADFYPQFIEKFTYKGGLCALPFRQTQSLARPAP
jgi:ABC-type glycerol-3-phosphate transport system substrate-binding protein